MVINNSPDFSWCRNQCQHLLVIFIFKIKYIFFFVDLKNKIDNITTKFFITFIKKGNKFFFNYDIRDFLVRLPFPFKLLTRKRCNRVNQNLMALLKKSDFYLFFHVHVRVLFRYDIRDINKIFWHWSNIQSSHKEKMTSFAYKFIYVKN